MKSRKVLFSLVLALVLCMTAGAAMAWGTGDYTISTVAELKAFADAVNSGNNFAGETITLKANLDLANENWTPIGCNDSTGKHPFSGNFDGDGKTIKNLYINDSSRDYAGLFGYVEGNGTIKSLTIENVNITARANVGAVAGGCMPYDFKDLTVKGSISINGHYKIGGVVGGGYVRMENCSVIGNGNGTITGTYLKSDYEGDNVGGIVGFIGEGTSFKTTNCSVSGVTVMGTRKIGGVAGSVFPDNTVSGSVSNLTVGTNATENYANSNTTTMGIGGLVGLYNKDQNTKGTLTGSVENVTLVNQNNVEATLGLTTGGQRGSSDTTNNPTESLSNIEITISGTNIGLTNDYIMADSDAVKYTNGTVVSPSHFLTYPDTKEMYEDDYTYNGSQSGLTFRSTANFNKATNYVVVFKLSGDYPVEGTNKIFAAKNADPAIVTFTPGSIVVELKQTLLDQLYNEHGVGTYGITVMENENTYGGFGEFAITGGNANTPKNPAPQTGDESNIALWISLMALSAAAFVVLGRKTRFN